MADKNSDPLATIIDFAWSTGADRFWVNNAKDELKKLRAKVAEYESLLEILAKPSAFAKVNDRGDLYDLRLSNNPMDDQNKVAKLYRI